MPIMLQSNHALFFDGVSDSVIIPQGNFSRVGEDYDKETDITRRSSASIVSHATGRGMVADLLGDGLAIEAWVVPDCGGVILMKEGQFRLSMGTVDTPGPVEFEANLTSASTGAMKVFLRSCSA